MKPIQNILCIGFALSICGHGLAWLLTMDRAPPIPDIPTPVEILPPPPAQPPPEEDAIAVSPNSTSPDPEPAVEETPSPPSQLALEHLVDPASEDEASGNAAQGGGDDLESIPLRIQWRSLAHIGSVVQELGLVVVGVRQVPNAPPEVVAEFRFEGGLHRVSPRKTYTGFSNRVRSLPAHLFTQATAGEPMGQILALVPVAVDRQWSRILEESLALETASKRENIRAAEARFVQRNGRLALEITKLVSTLQ